MHPSQIPVPYPLWFRIMCGSVPNVCLCVLCVAGAVGIQIPLPVAGSVAALCLWVMKKVL